MIIGKILLCIDLIRLPLNVGNMVLKGVRFFTDPIIDVSLEILREVVFKPGLASLRALENILAGKLGLSHEAVSPSAGIAFPSWDFSGGTVFGTIEDMLSRIGPLNNNAVIEKLGDFFALIGNKSYHFHQTFREQSLEIASSAKMSDRAICVFAGYYVFLATVVMVAIAGEANFGIASTGMAGEIRKNALFLKVSPVSQGTTVVALLEKSQ